ncbi:hypothetical protein GSI_09047 [Ganoderma sinense ZZ0214-1]|uniref:F-box domain-containing protein n=1 Tax=Ganoderma sinense ZZ0214-1 TaxID=1077348 RepID=A0A2G8S5F4_9APHY|nr:hypothetical protein GSI_09047 [Ganoderma sinense ZZ0214-1]
MVNLTRTWSCPLRSLSFKISEKIVLGDAFVSNIVNSHRLTLIHLSVRNCSLSKESMSLLCRKCVELETLKLSLPGKDMLLFADSLSHAKRIHTVTDVGDPHGNHASRAPIPKSDIRLLMTRQPNLEKVVADGRTWTAVRSPGQKNFEVHVKKNGPMLRHWFTPPSGVVVHA